MLVKCVFDIFVMFLAGIRAPFNASASLPVVFVAVAVVTNAVVVAVAATPAAVAVSVCGGRTEYKLLLHLYFA